MGNCLTNAFSSKKLEEETLLENLNKNVLELKNEIRSLNNELSQQLETLTSLLVKKSNVESDVDVVDNN